MIEVTFFDNILTEARTGLEFGRIREDSIGTT